MALFGDSKEKMRAFYGGSFNSKKGIFDYYFFIEGKSAEESEKLATLISQARGVPDVPSPKESQFDKIKTGIKQCSEIANENPKIAELLIGFLSGAVSSLSGVVIGNKISENSESPEQQKYEINRQTG